MSVAVVAVTFVAASVCGVATVVKPVLLSGLTTVCGFGSLSSYRDRAAYSTSVEDSVYVDEAWRRKGVGRLLLLELVELATRHGFHTVIGRIAGGNEASVVLHENCGFEVIGVEREVGRKFGRWLDVTLVQRLL